jgi:hypothetical protein
MAVVLECLASPAVHHPAVYEKYMARNLKRVSQYVRGEMDAGFKLPGAKRESSAAAGWRNMLVGGSLDAAAPRRKWDGGRPDESLRPSFAV